MSIKGKKKIKGGVVDEGTIEEAFEEPAPLKVIEPVRVDPKDNKFLIELGELIYLNSMNGDIIPFKEIGSEPQKLWYGRAAAALISLDKLNKMIVPKVDKADLEQDRNKHIDRLTAIIDAFVRKVKTLRCPKCGSTADSRSALFPSKELSYRILDGGVSE